MTAHCAHARLSVTRPDALSEAVRVICCDCHASQLIDPSVVRDHGWAGVRRALDGQAIE